MALLLMDGFDFYGTNCPISTRGWAITSGALSYSQAGRFGGYCLKGNSTSPCQTKIALPSANSTLSIGMAVNTTGTTGSAILYLYNGSGIQASLWYTPAGDLQLVRGSTYNSQVLGTALGVAPINTWCHIGLEFTRHASAGAANLYVNGSQVLSVTGVNSGSSDIDNIGFAVFNYQAVDDLYVVSGTTWLGEKRIDTLRPSADTAQKDWTPNSGSNNYSRVNETPVDGDTSYVSAATVGDKDIFDLGDLPVTPTSITAVQALVVAKKDDAATRKVAPVILSNATESVGNDYATAAGYGIGATIFTTDPDTSSAWTPSGVNALKAGYKVTA